MLLVLRGEAFIGIQFCWDGADMFEFSGKVIWPLAVSILNFPKDLRDKLNIGLHVVALCSGIYLKHVFLMYLQCIFDVFAMYFQCIYCKHVFSMYFRCICNGCNACEFPGITFSGTRVYPFYSRYVNQKFE